MLASTRARETSKDDDVVSSNKSSALEAFYASEGLQEEEDDRLDVSDFQPASRITEAGGRRSAVRAVWGMGAALSLPSASLCRQAE